MTKESSPHSVVVLYVVPRLKTSWSCTSTPLCIFLTVLYYARVQLYLYIYKTPTYLRGYVSFRWSVTVQT